MAQHQWKFFRAGGFDQVKLETGADLLHLDELDQKLWVALACPTTGLEFDAKTAALVDTDKDGQVSDAEWAVAKNKFQQNRHQEMKHRSANSHRRPDGHAPRKFDDRKGDVAAKEAFKHGWMMGKFDTNGDRKLDETERAAMRAAGEAKKREQMEKHLVKLKSIDADGDGQISDAEWAKAKENFKQDHPGKRPHETAPDAKA